MRARLTLFHGGVSGLVPGQKLLPPRLTDASSCSDYNGDHCRADRVYLTTDAEEAAVYAALATPGGHGDVYEVDPLDVLEPDPPAVPVTGSYATAGCDHSESHPPGLPVEEAAARMRTFLQTRTRV